MNLLFLFICLVSSILGLQCCGAKILKTYLKKTTVSLLGDSSKHKIISWLSLIVRHIHSTKTEWVPKMGQTWSYILGIRDEKTWFQLSRPSFTVYYKESSEVKNNEEITMKPRRPSIIKKYLLSDYKHPFLSAQHIFTQCLPCGRPILLTVCTTKQSH